MSSINLLQQTLKTLEDNNKSIDHILWVGNHEISFSWDEFTKVANFRCNYRGFNKHLKVVGQDWWLERHEYDGSEWWEFKTLPVNKLYKYKTPSKKDLADYCNCEEWEVKDCHCWEEKKDRFVEEIEIEGRRNDKR